MPGVSSSSLQNYVVNQHPNGWPSPNECVTAATIQDMNMAQDILSSKFGIPQMPHADLKSFTRMFDSMGPRNWLTRPPANVPIVGGMLLPQQAERVLNVHGEQLRETFGCGYTAKLTSDNTVDDLVENLQNGYPTSIHISQQVNLFKSSEGPGDYRALLGGVPHTVSLAGYDPATDTWKILDPAGVYNDIDTAKLMNLWGRQFIAYPPRLAMTTLIPDTSCALPPATTTPQAVPAATPPTPIGTPVPSQTLQPLRPGTPTSGKPEMGDRYVNLLEP